MPDAAARRARALAVAGMLATVLFWGTQLPLSQHVLKSIDQYYFGVLRYGIGFSLFALTLLWREGAAAFRPDGRAAALAWRGFCGFTVFGLVVFWAMLYTSAAHVSIILALQPMITAFWYWAAHGRRPAGHTLACILVAFAGLALVITRGDLRTALSAGSLTGDVMAFFGGLGWLVYTVGAQRFADWSPLRYTTLTCMIGSAGILVTTAILTPLGLAHVPSPAVVLEHLPAIVYIGIFPFYVAIFLFGIAVARLGAVNALLIGNATPVVVFAVDALRGHAPQPVEWAGASLVVGALIANNLLERRQAGRLAAR